MIHTNAHIPYPRQNGFPIDRLSTCLKEFRQIMADLDDIKDRESGVSSRELSLGITEGEVTLMWLEVALRVAPRR